MLKRGRKYDLSTLEFIGWTKGDGTSTAGYSVWDYFDRDGKYLGADRHKIAPKFRRKRANGKRRTQKRVSAALTKWLKKQNPAMKKATAVRVQRLKGGVIKLIPEKR